MHNLYTTSASRNLRRPPELAAAPHRLLRRRRRLRLNWRRISNRSRVVLSGHVVIVRIWVTHVYRIHQESRGSADIAWRKRRKPPPKRGLFHKTGAWHGSHADLDRPPCLVSPFYRNGKKKPTRSRNRRHRRTNSPALGQAHQEFPNFIFIHAGNTTLTKTAIFTDFMYGGGKGITHVNIMTLALHQFVHPH